MPQNQPSGTGLLLSPTAWSPDNNNNNNCIQRRSSRFFTNSSLRRELSPTRTLKWPRHNRVKITCNTSSAYHVQCVACHIVRRDSSAIKFNRVEIAFILALLYWLKPLTDEKISTMWAMLADVSRHILLTINLCSSGSTHQDDKVYPRLDEQLNTSLVTLLSADSGPHHQLLPNRQKHAQNYKHWCTDTVRIMEKPSNSLTDKVTNLAVAVNTFLTK